MLMCDRCGKEIPNANDIVVGSFILGYTQIQAVSHNIMPIGSLRMDFCGPCCEGLWNDLKSWRANKFVTLADTQVREIPKKRATSLRMGKVVVKEVERESMFRALEALEAKERKKKTAKSN